MTTLIGDSPAHAASRHRETRLLGLGIILSVAVHWTAFALAPTFRLSEIRRYGTTLDAVDLPPPEVEIPPPPEAIARPATPIVATAQVDEDITIAPTTFESNPVEVLPPPPLEDDDDLSRAPTFTPFTVNPVLQNPGEIAGLLQKVYPSALRDAGIGGTVVMWIFLDEEGVVRNKQVRESSGYDAFDAAALEVVPMMRFSPAYNRDRRVPVWISLDVLFEVVMG